MGRNSSTAPERVLKNLSIEKSLGKESGRVNLLPVAGEVLEPAGAKSSRAAVVDESDFAALAADFADARDANAFAPPRGSRRASRSETVKSNSKSSPPSSASESASSFVIPADSKDGSSGRLSAYTRAL